MYATKVGSNLRFCGVGSNVFIGFGYTYELNFCEWLAHCVVVLLGHA